MLNFHEFPIIVVRRGKNKQKTVKWEYEREKLDSTRPKPRTTFSGVNDVSIATQPFRSTVASYSHHYVILDEPNKK